MEETSDIKKRMRERKRAAKEAAKNLIPPQPVMWFNGRLCYKYNLNEPVPEVESCDDPQIQKWIKKEMRRPTVWIGNILYFLKKDPDLIPVPGIEKIPKPSKPKNEPTPGKYQSWVW